MSAHVARRAWSRLSMKCSAPLVNTAMIRSAPDTGRQVRTSAISSYCQLRSPLACDDPNRRQDFIVGRFLRASSSGAVRVAESASIVVVSTSIATGSRERVAMASPTVTSPAPGEDPTEASPRTGSRAEHDRSRRHVAGIDAGSDSTSCSWKRSQSKHRLSDRRAQVSSLRQGLASRKIIRALVLIRLHHLVLTHNVGRPLAAPRRTGILRDRSFSFGRGKISG